MKNLLQRLLWPLILLNNSCADLPKTPEGNLYITDVKTKSAYGHDIPLSVKGLPSPTVVVPFDKLDGYTCYDPKTSTNIEIYIQRMTELAKTRCQ